MVKNGFFVVFSKTVEPIWFHLLVKEDIIILHIRAKFQVHTIFGFLIYRVKWGSKGVKNEFFVIFSKTSKPILFHLLVKEDIIILRMCAKFQVQTIFCSQDVRSNRDEIGGKIEC